MQKNTNQIDALRGARYSVAEIAVILGVTEDSVYRYVRGGEIPHLRVGKRVIFPKAAIDKWMESAAVTAQG